MRFRNRAEAGKELAKKLQHFKGNTQTLVVGLPRGGVPIAYEIAQELNLPMDIICPRKIGAPMNKEFAIGAITETGKGLFDEENIRFLGITKDYIASEVEKEMEVAKRRLESYRLGAPKRILKGQTVILADDGLATGATMKAAIASSKSEGAARVIVAVPVAPSDTLEEIRDLSDGAYCLYTPGYFQAVGQFYEDFNPTEDEEVIQLMRLSLKM